MTRAVEIFVFHPPIVPPHATAPIAGFNFPVEYGSMHSMYSGLSIDFRGYPGIGPIMFHRPNRILLTLWLDSVIVLV